MIIQFDDKMKTVFLIKNQSEIQNLDPTFKNKLNIQSLNELLDFPKELLSNIVM